MRKYLHIDLADRSIRTDELHGEDICLAGRYLIAKTLLELGIAEVDPWSPQNPLIFSAGPFAGSNFSNANRISVGCKSPMTGGIKEANSGGTFAFALGQIEHAGFTLYGASDEWVVIRIAKDGQVGFESAAPYMGKGNFEVAQMLFERYGKKISYALCGPVGEYRGLAAGICFADTDGRPSRLSARGGVGAVMGSKKVKAIVCDLDKMPTFHDRKKLIGSIREYGARLKAEPAIQAFTKYGTAMMADLLNRLGGLPVKNFSSGRIAEAGEVLKVGGDFLRERMLSRGGEPEHACMPGCQIQCSNVYVDASGKELTSPLEYETLGLMGTNCGLEDPDDIALVNGIANDLGVDTIEVGATLGVMMDVGVGRFGDVDFMVQCLEDMRAGNERGRLIASGTAKVGAHYQAKRIPVIKNQGISAYDPRVIEVTGVSMMTTAMGADHTSGNAPGFDCKDKTTAEICEASYGQQVLIASVDSLGLCMFGRAVNNPGHDLIVRALNEAHGTHYEPAFLTRLGRECLEMEWRFNEQAGFTEADDELPEFFYREPLAPSDKAARHHAPEVNRCMRELRASAESVCDVTNPRAPRMPAPKLPVPKSFESPAAA